jgi:hypothetical protein
MKKHKTIPTILGILILLFGTIGGVYLVTNTNFTPTQAETEISPNDIKVSNFSDNSLTISFFTDSPTLGSVQWGTTPNLGNTTTEEDLTLKKSHYIVINDLEPGTTYYYKIGSGEAVFDNAGIPWQTQTLETIDSVPNSGVISGTVVDSAGSGVANAIVYVDSEGITTLSAQTQESGSFIIPLTLVDLDPEAVLQVFVQTESGETSSAQVLASSTNPIPQMVLGQTHDFRNIEVSPDTGLPKSSIDVPDENIELESKIILASTTPAPTPTKPVTLENIDEGQVVETDTPKFSGEAPAGTRLTITVESDPITEQLTVPPSGDWSWTVPEGLEPGEHTITIQWLDISGVLRELTRSFTVSAQEMPSASPTLKPSPTPKPSTSPSATPKATILATPTPMPVSGSLTHTLVVSIIGIGLVSMGIFISFKAKN